MSPGATSSRPTSERLTWIRSDALLWRVVLGDIVVVAADSDDGPLAIAGGAALWKMLERPCTASELGTGLSGGTHPSSSLSGSVLELLLDLENAGIVSRIEHG